MGEAKRRKEAGDTSYRGDAWKQHKPSKEVRWIHKMPPGRKRKRSTKKGVQS